MQEPSATKQELSDTMKPRFEPRDPEFDQLLKEAIELEQRLLKEQGVEFAQKEGTDLGDVQFHVQVGGETGVQNQYYSTNQRTISVEDIANKGAISEKSNVLDKNPHYPTALSTLDAHFLDGGSQKVQKSLVGADEHKFAVSELRKAVQKLRSRL